MTDAGARTPACRARNAAATWIVALAAACSSPPPVSEPATEPPPATIFELVLAPECGITAPFEGRALVYLSKTDPEPRTWNNYARLEPVLAADVGPVPPGAVIRIGPDDGIAYPVRVGELERGTYWAQAVLDVDEHAPWPGTAAGNPCSPPVKIELGGGRDRVVRLVCDRSVPVAQPSETRFVKSVEVESSLLSAFHGRPVRMRALVHLPREWHEEPDRRFPLFLFLSGFGASSATFQSVDWPAPPVGGEPFVTVYPDPSCAAGHSAFLDSDNNGPWGTAFVEEFLPAIEAAFRCARGREARVLAGHSSGGWAALWLIARHPDVFSAAWASSPDPVDFRDFMGVDLYAPDANVYRDEDGRLRPFCTLGGWTVNYTVEHARREEVLRGGVLAFFEALLGGRAADGRPERLFDRATGAVDPRVVASWSRHDLSRYLRENWEELGPALDGRLVVTIGDKDNFLLHGSVELLRHELAAVGANVEVHTLSGDHFSRLDGPRSDLQLQRIVERFRNWQRTSEGE